MLHDPLDLHQLVGFELTQLQESGHDVAAASADYATLAPGDLPGLEALLDRLAALPRLGTWTYTEPDALDEIAATWVVDDVAGFQPDPDRIHASWLGRIAGCNLGKPIEEGDHWTPRRIRDYLELFDAYPLRDYVPVTDPPTAGYEFRPNWPETTLGRVDGSARDDDIDYPILALHLLEQRGADLSTADVADAWLAYLPYARVYTAERATYVNLLHGMTPDEAGGRRNPYREWIGALIRGDAFGWVYAGRPYAAARASYADAVLSHRANGIYGELWAAALVASAFATRDARAAVERSLGVVPPGSRLAEAIRFVLELHATGIGWDDALAAIRERYEHYSWVHTVNNAAAIVVGLLWADGDFTVAVGNTVMSGWDTDSNGATVGSVMGALLGTEALPPQLIAPLRNVTQSAVFGYDDSAIDGLAARTVAVAATLT